MRAEWEPDELIDAWTLTGSDWDLVANKTGVTRLGFTVMLKFYEIEGRFPAYCEEVPQAAVTYLGSLVKVEPALFAKYSWRGRTIEYHRAQIRRAYGTRPPTEADEDRWAQWLAQEICPTETNRDRLAAALRRRCRSEKVEPPSTGQVERVIASGCRQFDDAFAATTAGRLGPVVCGRLEELLSRPNVLAELKSDPGPLKGSARSPSTRRCVPYSPTGWPNEATGPARTGRHCSSTNEAAGSRPAASATSSPPSPPMPASTAKASLPTPSATPSSPRSSAEAPTW